MLPTPVSNAQQTYEIIDNFIFNSCFDSGNLAKVQKVASFHVKFLIFNQKNSLFFSKISSFF